MKLPKLKIRFLQGKKRQSLIIWISIAAVVLSGAGYIVWSSQVWHTYPSAHQQWKKDVKAGIDRALALPADTPEQRAAAIEGLAVVVADSNVQQKTICQVSPLVAWQTVFDSPAKLEADCQNASKKIVSMNSQLQRIVHYLIDDANLANILATMPQSEELSEADWGMQPERWSEVIRKVESLSVGSDFALTKQFAVEKMTAVKVAWQEVTAAHEAKDKVTYLAAQNELANTYDTLKELNTQIAREFAQLSTAVSDSYKATF